LPDALVKIVAVPLLSISIHIYITFLVHILKLILI